jgi:ABC-type glycerol-3-phosphate transport system substrate-binding protein
LETDRASRRQWLALCGKVIALSGALPLLVACGGSQSSSTSAGGATSTAAGSTTSAANATSATATTSAATQVTKAAGAVTFWYPTQDLGNMIVKQYKQAQPDVNLTFVLGEYDTNTKTMAALAAGTPPDLSYLGRWQGPDLAVRNAIYSLDDKIKLAQSWRWEDVWPRLQNDSIQWGKTWVVPYSTDTRAFFYNKTLMEQAGLDPDKPPTDWQSMVTQAVKATKKNGAGKIDSIGFTPTFGNPPTYLTFYSLLWILGSDVVSSDHTKVTLQDKGAQAMGLIKSLMDQEGGYEQAQAFTTGLTLGTGVDAFSAGKVVFAMNGEWVFANYDKYSPNLQYGVIPGPVYQGGTEHFNYDGGGGWYYFKKGKNFDGAWQLTEFLMEKNFYTNFATAAGGIPALQPVANAWAAKDKRLQVFIATAATVRWIPIVVATLDMLNFISTMWDDILLGKAPVAQALKTAADGVQGILDQNNSYPAPQG